MSKDTVQDPVGSSAVDSSSAPVDCSCEEGEYLTADERAQLEERKHKGRSVRTFIPPDLSDPHTAAQVRFVEPRYRGGPVRKW